MAVSATLGQLGPRFGIGTNVSVYLRSQWARGVLSGAPSGGAVAGPVAIDTGGNATFAGLNPDTEYIIYANVAGQDVYISFFSGTGGTMSSARDVEVVAGGGGAGGTVDTELPAATAIADNAANPTVPAVASYPSVFDSSGNWFRLKSGQLSAASAAGVPNVTPTLAAAGGFYSLRAAQSVADADAGNLFPAALTMLWNGASHDRARTPNVFKDLASTAITAGTGATVWTPAAGKKFRLMGFMLSLSVAGSVIFADNVVGTVIFRTPALAAAGVIVVGADMLGNGKLSALANNVLKLDVTTTGNVAGVVFGTEE